MSSPAPAGLTRRAMRRVAFASLAGTTIEWYDFFIYGTAAALVFPAVFFPNLSGPVALMASFATFGVAFIARPLGAVVFGHYGDRIGRKKTLVASLMLMGFATLVIAFLPSASVIGAVAPAILVLMRLCQGLAVGGEWAGATLITAENAPANKRGHYAMYPQLGPALALMASSATFLASALLLTDEQFVSWGWRVPFFLSIALIGIGLWIRVTLEETTAFSAVLRTKGEKTRLPVADAFKYQWREILLCAGALTILFAAFYLGVSFLTSYGTSVVGLERTTVLSINIAAGGAFALATALSARYSDRVSRRTIIIVGNVFATVWALVLFHLLDVGTAWAFALGLCVTMAIVGTIYGPVGAYVPELFAARYRYSGAGIAYSLAGILGGSIPPLLATWLIENYGNQSIGYYLAAMGALSVICVVALRNSRPAAMPEHTEFADPSSVRATS